MKLDQEFAEVRHELAPREVQELSLVEIERLAAIAYHDEMQDDETKRSQGMSDKAHGDYSDLLETLDFEFTLLSMID